MCAPAEDEGSLATSCPFSEPRLAQGTGSPISCCFAEGGEGKGGRRRAGVLLRQERRGTSALGGEVSPPKRDLPATQPPAVYGKLALPWQEVGTGAHPEPMTTLALLARWPSVVS